MLEHKELCPQDTCRATSGAGSFDPLVCKTQTQPCGFCSHTLRVGADRGQSSVWVDRSSFNISPAAGRALVLLTILTIDEYHQA